jgi:hypothetical protein
MAQVGLSRTVQTDFSSGMWRAGAPELMPADGAFDLTNSLLDRRGQPFRRGGSAYRSTATFGTGIRLLWDGWLAGGQQTIVGTPGEWGLLEADGNVKGIGGTGLTNPGRPAAYNGVLYLPGGETWNGEKRGEAAKKTPFYAIVANRLLAATGDTVYFSVAGEPGKFEATDYHKLPEGVEIIGLEGGREDAVVFTTAGVWVIGKMTDNLTDESGNVQQTLDRYAPDMLLWGDAGIAGWESGLIVPTTNGVWLVKRGATSEVIESFVRLSDSIVDLYQEYVEGDFTPGVACVHQNHYFLPIVGPGRVVDLLVCRLDMEQKGKTWPWTRLQGYGAQVGATFSRVSVTGSRSPELIGGTYGLDSRIMNLGYLTPTQANHTDADGSVPEWSTTTRTFLTGNLVPNLVSRVRVRYQMEDEEGFPTLECGVSSSIAEEGAPTWGGGAEWGEGDFWTFGGDTATFTPLEELGPPSSDATKPMVWNVKRKTRLVAFQLSCREPTATLSLKSVELFVRLQGRI